MSDNLIRTFLLFEVILFICVFIYIIFHMVSYFSGKHIAVTEVKQGEIVTDNRFTALALRDETLVSSDDSGEAYYYLPNESRVKKNETIVSLDKTGDLIREIKNGTDDLKQIQINLTIKEWSV